MMTSRPRLLVFALLVMLILIPREKTYGTTSSSYSARDGHHHSNEYNEHSSARQNELIPFMGARMKDIIFITTNTQYQQIITRLAAIRVGVGPYSLQGVQQEPMYQADSSKKQVLPQMVELQESSWDIYVSAAGVFAKMASVCDLPKTKSSTGYFNIGADYFISEDVAVGMYAGYQGTKAWDHNANGSTLYSSGVKFGIYGTAQCHGFFKRSIPQRNGFTKSPRESFRSEWVDNFYVNAILGGGVHCFNINRSFSYDVWRRNWAARSKPCGGEVDSLLGAGYEFNLCSWRFGINNSIQYTYFGSPAYSESGARNLNTRVNGQNYSSLVYTLGANLSYLWKIDRNWQLFPTIGISWQHEFLNNGKTVSGRFDNHNRREGTAFNFYSPAGNRNYAFGVAGITAQLGRLGIYSYYTPEFGNGPVISHGIVLGVNFVF